MHVNDAPTRKLRSRITTLEGELRDAILRADASNTQLAEVRRTATDAQSRIAVLTAPDMSRIELAGQAVAPHRGPAFQRLLELQVIEEVEAASAWVRCSGCTCEPRARLVERLGDRLLAVCTL